MLTEYDDWLLPPDPVDGCEDTDCAAYDNCPHRLDVSACMAERAAEARYERESGR